MPDTPPPESFAAPVLFSSVSGMHYVPVPAEVAGPLRAAGVARVVVEVGGVALRRALVTVEGSPALIVGRDALRAAGLAPGDMAFLDLAADPDPDRIDLGEAFEAALAQDDEARARFDALPPGRQRSLAYYATSAKRPETQVKRALELAYKLRTGTLYSDGSG